MININMFEIKQQGLRPKVNLCVFKVNQHYGYTKCVNMKQIHISSNFSTKRRYQTKGIEFIDYD